MKSNSELTYKTKLLDSFEYDQINDFIAFY